MPYKLSVFVFVPPGDIHTYILTYLHPGALYIYIYRLLSLTFKALQGICWWGVIISNWYCNDFPLHSQFTQQHIAWQLLWQTFNFCLYNTWHFTCYFLGNFNMVAAILTVSTLLCFVMIIRHQQILPWCLVTICKGS